MQIQFSDADFLYFFCLFSWDVFECGLFTFVYVILFLILNNLQIFSLLSFYFAFFVVDLFVIHLKYYIFTIVGTKIFHLKCFYYGFLCLSVCPCRLYNNMYVFMLFVLFVCIYINTIKCNFSQAFKIDGCKCFFFCFFFHYIHFCDFLHFLISYIPVLDLCCFFIGNFFCFLVC